MILDRHQYGDPMRVLEIKQETEARKIKGCIGCDHKRTIVFKGENLHSCAIKRWIVKNCQDYQNAVK